MNQLLVKEDASFELEDLHLILIKSIKKDSEKTKTNARMLYEIYSSLMNPKYSENKITPEDAQIKLDAMMPRNNQGLIRTF